MAEADKRWIAREVKDFRVSMPKLTKIESEYTNISGTPYSSNSSKHFENKMEFSCKTCLEDY